VGLSTRTPVIGLSGRRTVARQLGAPAGFHDAPVDAYFSEYAVAVDGAGGLPVHLALDSDPESIADAIDGLVLSGGDDVDPFYYGAAVGPRTASVDPFRDDFELRVFTAMVAAGKPVLGICRGSQLINVALGGTLVPDLPVGHGESHASYAYPRAHRRHDVRFEVGSLAHRLYGARTRVNSFHHQAVERPGTGVRVTGLADDDVPEAIEVAGAPILGLQWHPECFGADPAFDWLVVGARGDRLTEQNNEKQIHIDGQEDAA
jgi:putative glutamine amidotransferase